MMKPIKTDSAPAPGGPYSQAIVAGPFVFVSGQRPVDPATGSIPDGVTDQTHQVLRNVRSVLGAAGAEMTDVVRVTTYLSDIDDFDAYNAVYREYFSEPFPARTTVGATLRGINVEIDVIAWLGRGQPSAGGRA